MVKPNYMVLPGYAPVGGGAATASTNTPPPTDFVPMDKVTIVPRFVTNQADASNLESLVKGCVPTFVATTSSMAPINKALGNPRATSILAHNRSSKRFVLHGNTSTCVEFSAARYPIFPAEMINDTVNPSGLAPEILEAWNTEIARLLATKGSATIAYVFKNGNANLSRYWVNQNETTLYYSNEWKTAGTWENSGYDQKFNGDFTSFSERKVGNLMQKMPLAVFPKMPSIPSYTAPAPKLPDV